jgi:hypothetical protein
MDHLGWGVDGLNERSRKLVEAGCAVHAMFMAAKIPL